MGDGQGLKVDKLWDGERGRMTLLVVNGAAAVGASASRTAIPGPSPACSASPGPAA